MKLKPALIKCVFVILPLVFLWSGFSFQRNNFPNDPEYIYLMNALCICDGQSVGHIDNPGTTLMQIGAGTIAIKHLIFNPDNNTLVEQVLKNPDVYIEATRKVIVVLNVLMLMFLGCIVFRKTGSVWIALLIQISTFLSVYILDTIWGKLSPEPLLFFMTGLYVSLALRFYHDENKRHWKYVILFALITGAGLATKATFLPLFILPLFIISSVKRKLYYLLGVIPSFVLFTIPAIPEYDRMFFWFRDMISHSGIYGNGEKGLIDTKTYFPNILSILSFFPGFAVILVTGILTLGAVFFSGKREIVAQELKYLGGLLTTFVVGILLVAKHYGGNHYLIPVLLLSGLTLFVLLRITGKLFSSEAIKTYLAPVAVFIFAVFILWNHPGQMIVSNRQYREASVEIDSANLWVSQNYGQYTPVNFYIYSINKFTGLKFGNDFAKGKLLSHLKKMFPKTYFYELSTNSYFNWNLKTSLSDIIETNGNKILLMNGPSDSTQIAEMEKLGFPLINVYKGKSQNIFILDTLKYKLPAEDKLQQIDSTICFNAETFSADGKFFIGSNAEIFGPVNALATEEHRSGSHSIKLDDSNPFALDYSLKNVEKGEIIQVEVWRKSDTPRGFLVLTTEDPNILYMAQKDAVNFDEKGWELLRVKIEIDGKLDGKNLKLYLWNPDRKAAYFDDLCIKKLYHATE